MNRLNQALRRNAGNRPLRRGRNKLRSFAQPFDRRDQPLQIVIGVRRSRTQRFNLPGLLRKRLLHRTDARSDLFVDSPFKGLKRALMGLLDFEV